MGCSHEKPFETRHGKSGWAGLISDARKSATRMYINKFVDGSRQETIDMLLGRLMGQSPVSLYDPINDYTQAELARRFVLNINRNELNQIS